MERWDGEEEARADVAKEMSVGDRLEARDCYGNWLAARVVGKQGEGAECEVLVHFHGWNSRWDEWVSAERVRPPDAASPREPLDAS